MQVQALRDRLPQGKTKITQNYTKMPIKGLTDCKAETYYPRLQVSIRAYKGEKKPDKGIGKDLQDRFRIETKNETIAAIINNHYGSLQPKALNIYLPYPDVERVFPTTMERYGASGIEFRCNGDYIYEETLLEEQNGHTYREKVEVNKPCLANGKVNRCPKCQKTGRLIFVIREVFESGFVNKSAMLTVHSFSDLTALMSQLSRHQQLMGSLSASPFPSPMTSGFVPFVLSRVQTDIKRPVLDKANEYKRTGKYSDGVAYPVSLDIDPQWLSAWMRWQQVEQIQSLGMAVNPLALKGFWNEDLLLPSGVSSDRAIMALPSSEVKDDVAIAVWEQFLGLLGRCDSMDKIHKAQAWVRSSNQWAKIERLPGIEEKVEGAIAKAEEKFF